MPEIQELEIVFDEDGLLRDPAQWNEAVAAEIARRDGIGRLTEEHWEIIRSLREHYAKFGVAPAMSHICRRHGKGRYWIHDLFHTCLGAWRVAGLPNPGEEAKTYLSDM
ncbi:MAG: TusE/DsrC/DsvC family sulfur relay protein [Gammaproteobacteria bacterium]|nr:TusE/DsrC/DsvC family sulfur relay protein [Gammaproteobacteria bacterium]MBI5782801.1 TusE/DsrC/DsvC family sulfur relay protein [Gammaproteobacteria bacterium]